MLTEKDYCDYDTCVALRELGYNAPQRLIPDYFGVFEEPQYDERIHLYDAQKWLREKKGIHIAPRIYLYHDINLDEQASWECTIYVEWSAIYTIGKSLTYEDALLLGIKEAVKILKENETIHR